MAHFGAKVLHPRTIRPAVSLGIPVRILSTFLPDEPGTLVTRDAPEESVKAVTAVKNLLLLTMDVPELADLAAASAAVFGALHGDRIEVVAASQASSRRRMTYVVDANGHGGCARVKQRMVAALEAADVDAKSAVKRTWPSWPRSGLASPRRRRPVAVPLHPRPAGVPVLSTNQQHRMWRSPWPCQEETPRAPCLPARRLYRGLSRPALGRGVHAAPTCWRRVCASGRPNVGINEGDLKRTEIVPAPGRGIGAKEATAR